MRVMVGPAAGLLCPPMEAEAQNRGSRRSPGPRWGAWGALGWGAFLACSWTWCIGMFLPVLLVRDYGLWGFLLFAAPNVVGAAGMGWVLWRDGASERMVARHRTAMVWFTCATLGFHVFWLAWLAGSIRQWLAAPGWAMALGALGGLIVGSAGALAAWRRPVRWATVAAPLTLGLSLAVLAIFLGAGHTRIAEAGTGIPAGAAGEAPEELLWLAPVIIFGFALCPYLDLTFHRARQALTGVAARLAFSVGFGIFFLAMIVLTLLYSGWLAGPVSGAGAVIAPALVAGALTAHLVGQATFTILAHASAAALRPGGERATALVWTVVLGPLAAVAALSIGGGLWGLSVGEIAYRSFLGLYGLAFPSYIWLVVIPTGRERGRPETPARKKVVVWAATVSIAAPLFGAGFLARQSHWLVAGMAIVLGARFVVRALSGGSRTASASE